MRESPEVRHPCNDGVGYCPACGRIMQAAAVQESGRAAVDLSIVVPCYNEDDGLDTLYHRLVAAGEASSRSFEIVFVNDGSTDGTWDRIGELAAADARIVGVNLSRNFGQERALTAGLAISRGELVLILDADGQDPPELLPQMLQLIDEGADVVYGRRRSRTGETWLKTATAAIFYRLLARMAEVPVPADTGNFRLARRRVVDAVLSMQEQNRYLRGLFSWVGFRQVPLLYDRQPRLAGASKWPWSQMTRLAGNAITGFSMRPLRIASWLSAVCFVVAVLFCCSWFMSRSDGRQAGESWLVIAVMAAFAGLHFLVIGILGEYLGRLCEQSRGRPLYVIESVVTRPRGVNKPRRHPAGIRGD